MEEFGNRSAGAGSRSREIRRDRVRNCALKKFANAADFVANAKVLSKSTRQKAWNGERLRERSVIELARYFKVKDFRYFLLVDPPPERKQTYVEYGIAQIIVRRIAASQITAMEDGIDGTPCPTNLFKECKHISRHPKISSCPCDDDTARKVCQRLVRDMIAVRVSENEYHLRSMTLDCLDQIIEHRVESELIQHRRQIEQLQHDPLAAKALGRRLKARLGLCRENLGNGIQFRLNDAEFHSEFAHAAEVALSLRGLVEMCDQPYMKMRLLLKNLFHESSEDYSNRIRSFNEGQLSDLEDIAEEYLRKKPRLTQIRQILCRHAGRQRQAFAECEVLLQAIKDQGDPYGFADYCSLGGDRL